MNRNCLTCKYEPEWEYRGSYKIGKCQLPLPPLCSMPLIWICEGTKDNDGLSMGASCLPLCHAYVERIVNE